MRKRRPSSLGRCKSSTITAQIRALIGAVFLTGGERGPVRQIALKNKRPPTEAASGLPAKGDNPSMYIPIGSGDQDAAYYERERPSGSYSKSISHLILRAFSDRAHSIDLQRKGSQIVPLSKSRHATSNFKTGHVFPSKISLRTFHRRNINTLPLLGCLTCIRAQ